MSVLSGFLFIVTSRFNLSKNVLQTIRMFAVVILFSQILPVLGRHLLT